MKVGDLVKYKHFPDETAIVVKVHPEPGTVGIHLVDVLSNCGEIVVCLDPDTFEVVNESR